MRWRGNFNSSERYLPSLMVLIEPIWTRQPVSQLAAQLGSFSYCGLHSCGTFDNDVRPSEPRQHSLYIFSNLLVIGLDGSGSFWTRTVIPHERGERFNDQHHFVCPSVCDGQGSLLIHGIIESKTWIGVVALNVVTFRHRLKKPNSRPPAGGQDGWRWEPARAAFPNRSAAVSSSLIVPFPSPPLPVLLSFPGTVSHWAAGNPPTSVERHPSLAVSSHFSRTCDLAPNDNDKLSIFRALEKWREGRKDFDGKNVYSLMAQEVSAWIRGSISGAEWSKWIRACLPSLTDYTRVKLHVSCPNNYHV